MNFYFICLYFDDFPQEYEKVGATVTDDISDASLVLGIKQVPLEQVMPDKTYCFFAHVIKAQEENMPLLDVLLENVCESLKRLFFLSHFLTFFQTFLVFSSLKKGVLVKIVPPFTCIHYTT